MSTLYHADRVHGAAFDREGHRIVSFGWDGARVWELPVHQERSARYRDGDILDAAFVGDVHHYLVGLADGSLCVWDSKGTQSLPFRFEAPLRHASLSPDAGRVAIETKTGSCEVWDPVKGQRLFVVEKCGIARFSPDGSRLATLEHSTPNQAPPLLQLWDTESGELVRELRIDGSLGAGDVVFGPDGQRIVVAVYDDKPSI